MCYIVQHIVKRISEIDGNGSSSFDVLGTLFIFLGWYSLYFSRHHFHHATTSKNFAREEKRQGKMDEKIIKYNDVSDLPVREGKPFIDENNLKVYSTSLLSAVKKEVERLLASVPSVLNCPSPTSDEDAIKNYGESLDRERDYYREIVVMLDKELERRKMEKS
jgi:hypothetical protein